jgi:drug/metabolite transporter (DMT)-like permease
MTRQRSPSRDVLGSQWGLLAVAAIWGSTFVVVKEAVAVGPPLAFIALRFSLAAVAILTLLRRRAMAWPAWRAGFPVGVLLFAGFATQTAGLQYTTAAKSAFITSTYVLFVPAAVWAIDRRRPGTREWGLAIVATLGLGLLVAPTTGWSAVNRGDVLTLACAFAFALHIVVLGRASVASDSLASLAAAQVAVCAALAAAASLLIELPPRLPASRQFLMAAVFTGLFATALAFGVQTASQRRIEASRAAILLSTEPLFAALVALGAGEAWSIREAVGAAVILATTIAAALPRR